MAAGSSNVTLECTECKRRNYRVNKTKNVTERLEIKKYCRFCKTHTLHKETK
jgi:large subunit ribosomal protein L33